MFAKLFDRCRAAAALMLATALGGSGFSAAAADGDMTKINLGALRFTSHAASFVAYEKGYFRAQGLDVEFKFFQAAQPMAVAVASGDVDFAVTAITGGLINLAAKDAVRVVGGALQEEPGVDGQMILASNAAFDAGLTDPAKLRGHSFGITQAGSSFHYIAYKIAEKEGFAGSDLQFKPLQKVGAIIAALKSGQIDSWAIVPHIGRALVDSDAAKKIGMVADYIPDYQVTTVFTSAKHAAEHADLVKRFLAAFAQGAADFNAALVDKTAGAQAAEDMVKLIHNYVYIDQSYDQAAPSIRNGAMRINAGAKLNLSSVKDQLAWFQSEGLVSDAITIEQLVDSSFTETY